jgi:periplasmic mercuric ion binding protein
MKTIKTIIPIVLLVIFSNTLFAQTTNNQNSTSTKTETFKVKGNCGMCKTRIEKAAKIEGVSKADWDSDTKMLTLTYDPSKVKSDDVLKKIADVGYDSDKFKADDKIYAKLPGCCKYKRD